jgi:hypothetical protein
MATEKKEVKNGGEIPSSNKGISIKRLFHPNHEREDLTPDERQDLGLGEVFNDGESLNDDFEGK